MPITNLQMIVDHASDYSKTVQEAQKYGLQVIPELIVPHDLKKNTGEIIQEEDWVTLVNTLASILGGSDPAAILLSMQESSTEVSSTTGDEEDWALKLPKISKSLTKRLPVVGSVRVMAGQNRMGSAVAAFKTAGFTGTILRYVSTDFSTNFDVPLVLSTDESHFVSFPNLF
jgi:hypothetical protein